MSTGEYITDVVNLLLARLDHLGELLERIAVALEQVNLTGENLMEPHDKDVT